MSHSVFIDEILPEGKTVFLRAKVVDEEDSPVPKAMIDALTVTLYDVGSGAIINSRDNQNILDTNGGSLHATSGDLLLEFSPADMVIVSTVPPQPRYEHHVARIEWGYNATRNGSCDIEFRVENMEKEP